ncbi:ankyrin repeat domain-containing protein 12 [Battus philenor]|uniref:ankyrin repeat domain-containing protein 12 n=1 Tax=Battus philenor TaxID=42288 RepID=UPI0035CF4343
MASTSKKRMHNSLCNIKESDLEMLVRSERKTRSKRQKENTEELSADFSNKTHYVRFPVNQEMDNLVNENINKSTRVLRRHTLKEHDNVIVSPKSSENKDKKTKNKRRTQKFVEETVSDITEEVTVERASEVKHKVKKNKKKKQKLVVETIENKENEKEATTKEKKKSKKKKILKSLKTKKVDNVADQTVHSPTLNISVDSYHSAAGSPDPGLHNGVPGEISTAESEKNNLVTEVLINKITPRRSKRITSVTIDDSENNCHTYDDTSDQVITKQKPKHKKLINKSTSKSPEKHVSQECEKFDGSYDKLNLNDSIQSTVNSNVEMFISSSERKSGARLSLSASSSKSSINILENPSDEIAVNNITFPKPSPNKEDVKTNLNLTFDKDRDSSEKSDTINVTFDKSNNSLVCISSDESINDKVATPLLIESSIDETAHSPIKSEETDKKDVPITPLKREGTYTKESSTSIESPEQPETNMSANIETSNRKLSMEGTPNRRKSLPSPGCTPFTTKESLQKNKTILNLTRSIEKPLRRSSLTEPIPRATRVMFCSPTHNITMASQVKNKVIKSSLKGSNKSFIFNENESDRTRPGIRKRSFTQNDADDAQIKRMRLASDHQQSVNKLSRPRTFSAAAKLTEPSTPSKKTATPVKSKPEAKLTRTKLPNFAALHQKRFEKMESLDQCQERKAKRARQLLTPTGSTNLLERVSPKEKGVDSPKKEAKETRKPTTPCRPKEHTLESLNPGYTRFGFKMNCSVNPFSIPVKRTAEKVKENKPNGLTRPAALPSLAGATSVRREAAKQIIMKEKSFTGKRDLKRNENRTIIKGVRTNRRFDLQMQMRNIHP